MTGTSHFTLKMEATLDLRNVGILPQHYTPSQRGSRLKFFFLSPLFLFSPIFLPSLSCSHSSCLSVGHTSVQQSILDNTGVPALLNIHSVLFRTVAYTWELHKRLHGWADSRGACLCVT